MVKVPERLQLDSFTLRRWRVRDVRDLEQAVGTSLDHLRPWMPWAGREPLTRSERRAVLRAWRADWRDGTDFAFGMFLDDAVVGSCGLHRRLGPGGLEIGYWVHVDHLRRGLATRAAAGLTTLAFSLPGIEWTEIHHDQANAASRRVPEKLGYRMLRQQQDLVEAPAETGTSWIWRMDRGSWHDPFGWRIL